VIRDLLGHPLARLARPQGPADVGRCFLLPHGFEHGGFDLLRFASHAQMRQHHSRRQNRTEGLAIFFPAIGGAEPCTGSNIEVFPDAGWRSRPSEAALQSGGEIGDDIAEHIICDDDVEAARIAHHLHAERVDVHVLRFDLRKRRRDFLEHALPQAAGVGHGVGLVAHQDAAARRAVHFFATGAVLERVADDAFDALARVDVFLDRNFVGRSLFENTAEVAVNTLGIFAEYDEINVFGSMPLSGQSDASIRRTGRTLA